MCSVEWPFTYTVYETTSLKWRPWIDRFYFRLPTTTSPLYWRCRKYLLGRICKQKCDKFLTTILNFREISVIIFSSTSRFQFHAIIISHKQNKIPLHVHMKRTCTRFKILIVKIKIYLYNVYILFLCLNKFKKI